MEIVYMDEALIVCVKPAGALSTDEPGGVPDLLRESLGDPHAELRTVHRLDRVVGGLMALGRSAEAASELSRQIREGSFEKEYLAVVRGETADGGEMVDLLVRDRARKMTFVTGESGKGVQEARLRFETLERAQGMSLVRIRLLTGRTHQIRCQFAHRGMPLVGERKYCQAQEDCALALWSCRLAFRHPVTAEKLEFLRSPPECFPWTSMKKL